MEPDNPSETPLVNQQYILEKFSGKGGWTFVVIPEILKDKHAYFGWVKVKGTIDGYEIKNYHLMSMGGGVMFLPVKAGIRKAIGKSEGEWVHVILYADQLPPVNRDDFMTCLQEEPLAYRNFLNKPEAEQKAFIDWIYAARNDETKVERIAEILNKLNR
ncbi:MAG: YdeI/OmpD-associated family protein [Bacteroidota bacterium]|nr:YdeI/OmpD-associated family protein [Bacteroidota bacterium]